MPCFDPRQAGYNLLPSGKKKLIWSPSESCEGSLVLPCGKCIGCKLKHSREWGLRCVHEAKMHADNSFVTLTFNDEFLPKMCPTGSLAQEHISDFVRALRDKVQYRDAGFRVRYFGCGEYGPKLGRPHYHLCLFGFDFLDKKRWRKRNGFDYFVSETLQSLWPYGFSVIGSLTMDSASYVARYCTKKITGEPAKVHYDGRKPEFSSMSGKPGVGHSFFYKFSDTDIIPHNCCIVDGQKCPVPRYYDQLWEKKDPESFARAKEQRREIALELAEDNSFDRLMTKMKCQEARFKKLYRILEAEC